MALGWARMQRGFQDAREILGDRLREGSLYRPLADHGHLIGLTMQTLDNSITTRLTRTRLGRTKITSEQGHGDPNPTWIPIANQTMRSVASRIGGFPLNSIGEIIDIP
jgi:cholesterol oxidase